MIIPLTKVNPYTFAFKRCNGCGKLRAEQLLNGKHCTICVNGTSPQFKRKERT